MQSLLLLNGAFAASQAAALAKDLRPLAPEDRIRAAFDRIYGRPAEALEIQSSQAFIKSQQEHILSSEAENDQPNNAASATDRAMTNLCHMLLISNEFLYVD